MQLPEDLQHAIEQLSSPFSLAALSAASSELSERYRSPSEKKMFVHTDKDRIAYIMARMPATYAAIYRVFEELKQRMPGFAPESFFDLGSGPGTGLWVSSLFFPSLQKKIAWEKDIGFISIGKKLASLAEASDLQRVEWQERDIEKQFDFPSCDMALLSYSIGEMKEEIWEKLLNSLWNSVQKVLIIIEPGTPVGYKRILNFRNFFIEKGSHILAPCPHKNTCPLAQNDWCHFYSRIQRSSLHRKTKEASLNYEDEKFSYLILSKQECLSTYRGRILRHPQKNKGHVSFTLCTSDGVKKEIISKKENEKYKYAKKLDWGDSI